MAANSEPIRETVLDQDARLLAKRLRGQYPIGPILKNGEPEFGWREFNSVPIIPDPSAPGWTLRPPIFKEAADVIDRMRFDSVMWHWEPKSRKRQR